MCFFPQLIRKKATRQLVLDSDPNQQLKKNLMMMINMYDIRYDTQKHIIQPNDFEAGISKQITEDKKKYIHIHISSQSNIQSALYTFQYSLGNFVFRFKISWNSLWKLHSCGCDVVVAIFFFSRHWQKESGGIVNETDRNKKLFSFFFLYWNNVTSQHCTLSHQYHMRSG